ncbi:M10 family metallopeptidase C-terminal domain-containing protein [Azospirillum sp.]|uniref:M10 family metallopeptidase C-terminal domain-containing protein n=1 Tax=Azospirillum sp. TaxID=34012 RepID=UPI002D3EF31C|nr:M10 family metallopeptidase C-terminal domain-containing protein [Azospirillum sp.]HYD70968.1 M10 family metallopeptidase C-terminal domain-containing protein [Azospirillum sp.]
MATITGIRTIDALLFGPGERLNYPNVPGSPVTVTYSFLEAGAQIPAGHPGGFAPMSEAIRGGMRRAMDAWEEVCNIRFVEVASGGTLRYGTNNQTDESTGYVTEPLPGQAPYYLFLNNASTGLEDQSDGSWGYFASLHELGHLLGLKHPGDYNGATTGGVFDGPYLPVTEDTETYSVMAYAPSASGLVPVTPMVYDIAAVQYLYGANLTTRTGDDVYSVTDAPLMRTIWDAYGTDAIDAEDVTGDALIDLNAGAYSDIGVPYSLAIADGVTIENAVGGSGDDTIRGNGAANELHGGMGSDSLLGAAGTDVLYGNQGGDALLAGDGNDTLFGGQGGDAVSGDAGEDLLYGNLGNDSLNGGLGNDMIFGGQGDDVVYDPTGNDSILGGVGNDTLVGGRGNDIIDGGAGDDVLAGDGHAGLAGIYGADTLIGGAGADRFAYAVMPGHDVVADFNAAEGDRIQVARGLAYTVDRAADGSAMLRFGDSGDVTLLGVPAASFQAAWVVVG